MSLLWFVTCEICKDTKDAKWVNGKTFNANNVLFQLTLRSSLLSKYLFKNTIDIEIHLKTKTEINMLIYAIQTQSVHSFVHYKITYNTHFKSIPSNSL